MSGHMIVFVKNGLHSTPGSNELNSCKKTPNMTRICVERPW